MMDEETLKELKRIYEILGAIIGKLREGKK